MVSDKFDLVLTLYLYLTINLDFKCIIPHTQKYVFNQYLLVWLEDSENRL